MQNIFLGPHIVKNINCQDENLEDLHNNKSFSHFGKYLKVSRSKAPNVITPSPGHTLLVHHNLHQSLPDVGQWQLPSQRLALSSSPCLSHTVSLPPSHSLPSLPDFLSSFFLFILGLLYSFSIPAWHLRQLNLFLKHDVTVLHKTLYPEPSTIEHFFRQPSLIVMKTTALHFWYLIHSQVLLSTQLEFLENHLQTQHSPTS